MFVSWATGSRFGLTAPWNVLDEISLDGLVLSFNFETKDVRLTKPLDPPLDLGFLAITELTLTYGPDPETNNDKAVLVSLKGRFPWKQENGDALGWDATEPCVADLWHGGGAPTPCTGWARGVGDRNEPRDSEPVSQRDPAPLLF